VPSVKTADRKLNTPLKENSFIGLLRRQKTCDIIAYTVIVLMTVWLLLDCKFSVGFALDEAFYLTIPKRLLAGDGLLTDEWQLSQLSSVLLLPFVKLWYIFHDSSEGMYLQFSYLYAVTQGLFAAGVYTLMRKYGYFSLLAVACMFYYSLMNFSSLSYNTLGVIFCTLLMCLLLRQAEKPSEISAFFSGFCYAGLVLCNPVTVFAFPFYLAAAVVVYANIRSNPKAKKQPYYLLTPKGAGLFIAGILPLFVYFMAVLFAHSSIKDILSGIPYILSDSEHMVVDGENGIQTFSFGDFFTQLTGNMGAAALIISLILTLTACLTAKKNRVIAAAVGSCAALISFAGVLVHYLSSSYETDDPGLVFFVLLLCGFSLYFLTGRAAKPAFYIFVVGALFYALCMQIASNLGYHAQINGYVCCTPGVMILLKDFLSDIRTEEKKTFRRVYLASGSAVLSLALFVSFFYPIGVKSGVFNISAPSTMIMKMGFLEGKNLLKDEYAAFAYIYSDMKALDEIAEEGDRLFIANNLPLAYMETDKLTVGGPSAWYITEREFSFDSGVERLFSYYELYPENIPDFIYVSSIGFLKTNVISVYPKEYMATYISPYFEGEVISLNHGLVLRVTGIKDRSAG